MNQRTLKISDKQIDFIRLITRSPDKGGGWRNVSDSLKKFALGVVDEQPELYETKLTHDGLALRLSQRGAILGEYL